MFSSASFLLFCALARAAFAQLEGTPQHEQKFTQERNKLDNTIKLTNENNSTSAYLFEEPHEEDFIIGIAVNPCGVNTTMKHIPPALGYDCCIDRSPALEYSWLKQDVVTLISQRKSEYKPGMSKSRIEAAPDEILNNIDLVDIRGNPIQVRSTRYLLLL